MITVDLVKQYSRIDADDSIIQVMLTSASSFFRNKGVVESLLTDDEDKDLYNLSMLMLVDHWYNNRGAYSDKDLKTIPLGVISNLFTLQLACRRRE